ncbi:MAG: hypothetical protein ACSLFN_12105 [Candidatus Limnocylindrales bacterium]
MVGERLATEIPFEAPDPVSDRSMLILQYVMAGIALAVALLLGAIH